MRNIYLIIIFLAFISCANEELISDADTHISDLTEISVEQEYLKGYVRVLITENLSDKVEAAALLGVQPTRALEADDVVSLVNIRSMKRTFPAAGRFEERTRKAGLHL